MQNLKVLLATGAGLATAVVVACSSSSSSSPAAGNTDAGDDGATAITGDAAAAMGCLPLNGTGCAMGSACCLDLSGGLAAITNGGACVAPGTCKVGVEVGCTQGSDCAGGQVCCADLGGAGDGGLAALEEGGLAALGVDAAALSLDAGAGGLGALANVSFKTTCSSACTGSQIQACSTATECVGAGSSCVSITSLAGDAGGGDGGLLGGLGMYASALGMYKACLTPPSDAAAVPDDTGTDAVAPTDAPADAVSE
jgi:hypothetical protein